MVRHRTPALDGEGRRTDYRTPDPGSCGDDIGVLGDERLLVLANALSRDISRKSKAGRNGRLSSCMQRQWICYLPRGADRDPFPWRGANALPHRQVRPWIVGWEIPFSRYSSGESV